ncbi:MAG: phage tail protein [Burkholderiaceae bacterium]|nr:phage tail protein [Burkholderiaceae bacterium]
MAANNAEQTNTIWPLPKFYFEVNWNGILMSFQEVSGLDTETKVVEYRHTDSPVFSTTRMPGLRKIGNVTLKRGIASSDDHLWGLIDDIKMNEIKRVPITISLLDEKGKPAMAWTLTNAWPTKITGTDLKADGNEVAIEQIEIAYETMTVANT